MRFEHEFPAKERLGRQGRSRPDNVQMPPSTVGRQQRRPIIYDCARMGVAGGTLCLYNPESVASERARESIMNSERADRECIVQAF